MLEEALKAVVNGDIHFDAISRRIYSVDASIYEVEPLGVLLPKSIKDLVAAVNIARKAKVPVVPRGAATGITGGCLGEGLIIDTSKYLNQILDINIEEEYVWCEPGVVQDRLNDALAPSGYRLGPDTSTGNRATIGGMLANNSAGARSLRYGKMSDHVLEVQLLLANGEPINFSHCTWTEKRGQKSTEGRIYDALFAIREKYMEEIKRRFPDIPRRVSGYNLNALIEENGVNVGKLIAGSEGTLGIITAVKMRIAKKPKQSGLVLIFVDDMTAAMRRIPDILAHNPLAVEMLDNKILESGKSAPSLRGKTTWIESIPEALFVIEFDADDETSLQKKMADCKNSIHMGTKTLLVTSPEEMANVWAVRKAGLGLLLSKRSYSRAIAFIEDISVPPTRLADFMTEFRAYLASVGKDAGIYGHVGSGCMHIRPYIDLRDTNDQQLMLKIINDVADLLVKYGGTPSGEHGDGLVRSWLNKKIFGEQLYNAFLEVKAAFDPHNLMNPNKIVNGPPLLEHLRLTPETHIQQIDTFLDFSKEGGFPLAVDMCNGNGQCRKAENLMCPSFQASNDEYHTTRARAQTLRGIINSKVPLDTLTSKEVYDVLDLCLECKGCKTECPSQVDMAKMKAEVLYKYNEKHGIPLRAHLFARIGDLYNAATPIRGIFNWIAQSALSKALMSAIGITPKRSLPPIAKERFSQWLQKHEISLDGDVVLFNDTFTEFNFPGIGTSAYNVLKAMGFSPVVPPWHCCGRPALSKGLLPLARKKATALIELLHPYAERGIPIIGLEPSCILTIKDDHPSLVTQELRDKANTVAAMCTTFDSFLVKNLDKLSIRSATPLNILFHTHCHQKALVGSQATLSLLRAIGNTTVNEIPSGCCGVAGSFGYEKEHYDFSVAIGNLHLIPAVNAAPQESVLIANGTSCRSQITHNTARTPLHIAELIASLLQP